jgi:uncharacterized protein (DUF58 family)
MIRPTVRLVLVATLGLGAALLPAVVDPRMWTVWIGVVAATGLAAGLDALAALGRRDLAVTVREPGILYVGDEDPLEVEIESRRGGMGARVTVLADVSDLLAPPDPVTVTVPPGGTGIARVPLRPARRGTAEVRAVWLRWPGAFGLTTRVVRVPVDRRIGAVPNVRAVRSAALRYFRTKEFLTGQKSTSFLGDGSEFDSLREYLPGFDSRAIDWKASARHVKMIAREYRAERNNQIVVALDTGHLMMEPMAGIPKLDHAINAGLLLTFAALKTGDRIGLFAFDSKVRFFLAPRGGMGWFPGMQGRSAEIDYAVDETNFTLGLSTLLGRLTRRTLVVLFTDFVDTVTAELMVENLSLLASRHLVLVVTLRDPELMAITEARPDDVRALHRAVVAADLVREREIVLRRLRRLGIHVIDARVEEVSSELINRYLEIKRRELV